MKSIILFSTILLGMSLSCKKETQYRNASVQDTIITPDTVVKQDTLLVRDTLSSDTLAYPKDSLVRKSKK